MVGWKGIRDSIVIGHYIIHFFILFLGDAELMAGGLKFRESPKSRQSSDPTGPLTPPLRCPLCLKRIPAVKVVQDTRVCFCPFRRSHLPAVELFHRFGTRSTKCLHFLFILLCPFLVWLGWAISYQWVSKSQGEYKLDMKSTKHIGTQDSCIYLFIIYVEQAQFLPCELAVKCINLHV